ncbi:hypothetical protein cand_025910 [Cryptosporidium andersoni]|uniref:Serine aminopeptidase S33 domain-containing protein n=1 Tax=Cryptosporidium andersoni TaxID=117008 RepID=A0A1J4MB22_9CRYT|nr:hypothetical protein cand_025910 [Cryptosporidium andersoni]
MLIQRFADAAMFPGTYSSYEVTSYPEIILLPSPIDVNTKMPCLLFTAKKTSHILIVYAHGNGVDIGELHARFKYMGDRLKVHFFAFDYPGYGKHGGRSDESTVDMCMNIVMGFITQQLQWPLENIILWGCSIGSGPTTRYAKILNQNKQNLGGLILQCPFKSIKHAAESFAGKIGRLLITQRWNVQAEVAECSCPVLWIHGKKDSMFSWFGSYEMYNNYHTNKRSCHFPDDATHHFFDMEQDIIKPVDNFIRKFILKNTKRVCNFKNNGGKIKNLRGRISQSILNPFRPTVLDTYLTRNINAKTSNNSSGISSNSSMTLNPTLSMRIIGPKDFKTALFFWSGNHDTIEPFSSSAYLDGEFPVKYIWLNGESGEYTNNDGRYLTEDLTASSSYLISSDESELDDDDGDNVIHLNYPASQINMGKTSFRYIGRRLNRYKQVPLQTGYTLLGDPTYFRHECRQMFEKLGMKPFTNSNELLLNFWPIQNLYRYLYNQFKVFFQIILEQIELQNFSFITNSKDTFMSIICWVRRMYYLYTPSLFMNTIYAYQATIDQWVLDGVNIGNIYVQLQSINGIKGRMVVNLLEKSPISRNFPPPFYLIVPLYIPPKPYFQPIAEWIVRYMYHLHTVNVKTGISKNSKSKSKSNLSSFSTLNSLETTCLLEELTYSVLNNFLLCRKRPKLEKLCLTTGMGNWFPFGWDEFFIKLFEINSSFYIHKMNLSFGNIYTDDNLMRSMNYDQSSFLKLLIPHHLPESASLEILFAILKTKIKTRSEWIESIKKAALSSSNCSNTSEKSAAMNEVEMLVSREKAIDSLKSLSPEICQNVFNTLILIIKMALLLPFGISSESNAYEDTNKNDTQQFTYKEVNPKSLNESIEGNKHTEKEEYYFVNTKNGKQANWGNILGSMETFTEFMNKINYCQVKLPLPGISQSFRGKLTSNNRYWKRYISEDNFKIYDTSETEMNIDVMRLTEIQDKITYICETDGSQSLEIPVYYDKIESPEQQDARSFHGKIIMKSCDDNIINSSECGSETNINICDNITDSSNQDNSQINYNSSENKGIEDENVKCIVNKGKSDELPLTWESVLLNSKNPLMIINKMSYHDKIYMGMAPSNYTILHRWLYEKYPFLRLDHESEYIFQLLWHFAHCCLYHGSLLMKPSNISEVSNPNISEVFQLCSKVYPIQCLLLIISITRRAIENPNYADIPLLNWYENNKLDKKSNYLGFNSACSHISLSENKYLYILESILSISMEILEQGVCDQIVHYKIDNDNNINISNLATECLETNAQATNQLLPFRSDLIPPSCSSTFESIQKQTINDDEDKQKVIIYSSSSLTDLNNSQIRESKEPKFPKDTRILRIHNYSSAENNIGANKGIHENTSQIPLSEVTTRKSRSISLSPLRILKFKK